MNAYPKKCIRIFRVEFILIALKWLEWKNIKWWYISYNTIQYYTETKRKTLKTTVWTKMDELHKYSSEQIKRHKTVYVNPFIWSSKMDKTNMFVFIFIYMEDSEFYKCSRNFLI